MDVRLQLSDFVKLQELYCEDVKFNPASCAFDFLGTPLKNWLAELLVSLGVKDKAKVHGDVNPNALIEGPVYVAKGARVEAFAYIQGPTYIGPGSEVRHGAYVRGNVYLGKECVVGHSSEVKGSVLFDRAKAAHFAYVGDSILGQDVNLGAGTKLANLKLAGNEVSFIDPNLSKKVKSGLRKFGAILGDHSQTGCNSVLSPGSLLLPKALVMPCAHFHGTLKNGVAK